MKEYTKTEIKRTAIAAFESYTGARGTKLCDVTLLESSDDRTYILFSVHGIEYRFDSYICDRYVWEGKECVCVWVGDGTVERIGRRRKDGSIC